MFIQTIISLHPLKMLLGDFDFGSLLSGLDLFELLFSVLNQITFLVDIVIASVLVAAVVRGIFKKFWKVVWRGLLFSLILVAIVIFAAQIGTILGGLPISLKGDVNGVPVVYANLQEVIYNVVLQSGQTEAYALALTDVVLKNLALFVGVPVAGVAALVLSAITYPIIKLFIPRKMRDIKLIPVKLALSIAFSLIGIIVFALPMATLVPPMTAIKETIADDTLLRKFLNPEFIGFLELFTAEKSTVLKIVSFGANPSGLNIFNKFSVDGTSYNLKDVLPAIFEQLNTISFTPAETVLPAI